MGVLFRNTANMADPHDLDRWMISSYIFFIGGAIYLLFEVGFYFHKFKPRVSMFHFRSTTSELLSIIIVLPLILIIGSWILWWIEHIEHNALIIALAYLLPIHWLLLARAGISDGWESNKSLWPSSGSTVFVLVLCLIIFGFYEYL